MRKAIGAVFWLAVLAVPAAMFWNPSVNVTFTADEIEAIVERKLPFSGSRRGVEFEIPKGVRIEFREDGKVGIATGFIAKPSLTQESRFEGQVRANARVVYEDRAFFARELQLDDIAGEVMLSDRAAALRDMLGQTARALGGIAGERIGEALQMSDVGARAFEFLAERIERIPLYEMDKAGYLAQLAGGALQDLRVEEQTLVAEIGLGALVTNIVLIVAVAFIVLVVIYFLWNGGLAAVVRLLVFATDGDC